jgi:hypothetical protein
MPASKPVLDQLVLDDEGNLWARRYGDADDFPRYDVFSRDGSYLGSVVLATKVSRFLKPRIVRGSIYTLALDDMDVPSVVRATPDVLISADERRGARVATPLHGVIALFPVISYSLTTRLSSRMSEASVGIYSPLRVAGIGAG